MLLQRLRFGLLAGSLLAVVACTLPPKDDHPPADTRDASGPAGPGDTPDEARKAAASVNSFAADLYAQLRGGAGNLIVSPYSIGVALAMTATGAEGNTRRELDTVLHLSGEKADTGRAFRRMTESVTAPPRFSLHKPELSVANSLWLNRGHPFKKEFLTAAHQDFRAGVYEVNFALNPGGACADINRWVEKETHNRIKDLLSPDALNGDTQAVLANAIYFKARWAASFKKGDTKVEDFRLTNGTTVRTPLMYQKEDFRLVEKERLQVLRMPYDGKATAMYVLLPQAHDGLPALERELTAANLVAWTDGTGQGGDVKVWLPPFKFTVPTELTDVLQKMGVKDAFIKPVANFKGMTDHPAGLYISRVTHKAFVELDEVGTEAAAATAVVMALGAAAPGSQPPPERVFRADHPFLFVIKHEPTGAILFIGRVLDPTK